MKLHPKYDFTGRATYLSSYVCYGKTDRNCYLSACSPADQVTPVLVPVKASSPAPRSTTSRYAMRTQKHTSTGRKLFSSDPSHPQWLQQCFLLAFQQVLAGNSSRLKEYRRRKMLEFRASLIEILQNKNTVTYSDRMFKKKKRERETDA